MNKMSNSVKEQRTVETKKPVTNFMGGTSYEYSPLETLKMITASSIFGEPSYYRDGEFTPAKVKDGFYETDICFKDYSILPSEFEELKTSEIMEKAIDDALEFDFEATLEWAKTLRTEYNMRLNPQIILVRAATHPKRKEFTEKNKYAFSDTQKIVMQRADEPVSQLTYYLFKKKSKKDIPSILKRTWAAKLSSLSPYQLHKYKNAGIGMIDTVRICHAHSDSIDELMRTGNINVKEDDKTWEMLHSQGKSWKEILETIELGHMALLRNLRNIFTEIDDVQICRAMLEKLKQGVPSGKQFPFRYFTAYKMIEKDQKVNHKAFILDALEECMDIACDKNMPKLKGKTMCLSDNSGSAWGTFNSEYGSVTVAEIDNLSSVIAARNSEEGYVGKFGNKLKTYPVSKHNGILSQTENISKGGGDDVGTDTEGGIWKFFRDAIANKTHYDNIFIFSDQQAGHGGLYGTSTDIKEYKKDFRAPDGYKYDVHIDVAKLIAQYRNTVNPKVNVFSVQTAGYNNMLIPEYGYRTNLLYGWTGKETVFADAMIKLWDEKDAKKKK